MIENSRIKLCLLHKLPTPYNDAFFRALHQDHRIDLSVYHLWRGSWRRPWKSELGSGYPNKYMHLILGIDWKFLWEAWSIPDSFFIVADWGHLVSLAAILARYLRKVPVAIWCDTPQEEIPRPWLKKQLRRILLRWFLPRLDVVFGTGTPALNVLEAMGARSERLVNLPVCVDLDRPLEARRDSVILAQAQRLRDSVGCAEGGIVFSMNGTLVKGKGHDIGLKALAYCNEQYSGRIGLLVAGEGPERKDLERMMTDLHLDGTVNFLGWQEPEEMDAVYLASDAILHPARYDPFPLVVLETMSWSKVIIGSDVCGSVQDRVQHGINGFSFPSEDASTLARIMIDLVSHPDQLHQIGERARRTAEEWPISRNVEIVLEQAKLVLAQRK